MITRSKFYPNSAASRTEKEHARATLKKSANPQSIPFFVVDFESFKNGEDVGIYQIAFTGCYWYGPRIRTRANTTFVIDVIDVKTHAEEMNVNKKWNERLISGQNTAHENDIPHLTMTLQDAINMLLDYVLSYGNGNLMSFCYELDMQIVKNTETFLNKKNGTSLNIFDDPRWHLLNHICIRSMLSNDCPKYMKSFYSFAENYKLFTKNNNYKTRLETHSCFARNSLGYKQNHDPINDVFDSVVVLQKAAKFDGCPILNDDDHLEEVVNVPCLKKERSMYSAQQRLKLADELQAQYENDNAIIHGLSKTA
jgi:hypothetical protein